MIESYNGRRFSFTEYNCYHHVFEVRIDAGLITPAINMPNTKEGIWPEIRRMIDEGYAEIVDTPKNYDVAVFDEPIGHIGIYVDGLISHCGAANKCVVIDHPDNIMGEITYLRVIP